MITGECQCAERCGRPATCNGPPGVVYSDTCWQRWRRAGKPAGGVSPGRPPREPDPPVEEWDAEPDPAELAARWGWVDPQLRRDRAIPAAAALVRCVQAKDRAGVEIVTSKCTDWGAMLVIVAEWADQSKIAVKSGTKRVEAA